VSLEKDALRISSWH